ncbi:VWA domain-containing protein [Methanoculleus bourgensis]|uniref:von Willebrand factor, type A n=1 Tax=Methanoculleus bourgensis TaxID=83986 RepID=A0A0X3BN89_9EURY|nr:VWA domain-containing protein [Methanoculleus bourgensis]CVK33359.1 von Willebrand factor, type A [Methanoculleus bourgensis]
MTAGDTTTITLGLADRHGNPVDNRKVAETVRFSVGSVNDDAVFIAGGTAVRELEQAVDATGNVSVPLRTGRTAGENIIGITVNPGVIERYISIRGLPTGHPAAITASVRPDANPVPYQPADGKSTFTLSFTLFDAWGNPAAGRDIRVGTSLGEDAVLMTNGRGGVAFTYGPKGTTGRVTITATAIDNQSVTTSTTVEFIHTDPVEMLLSASPQSMPSRDVNENSVSELRAKVMDIKGNPAAGETVEFKIVANSSAPYNQTVDQKLEKVSATTDRDGYAVVKFYPGAFTADRKAPGWDAAAKGTATVRATWENKALGRNATQDITLTWMNYPYLSVETNVSSPRVEVNETVDVTIRLKGDGWALQPDPIDVVLVIDRSGSMRGQRITDAKAAAKTFVSKMNPARDRIGLVSYSTNADLDLPLGDDYSKVNSTVKDLSASGWTATRQALYLAIQEMVAHKNPDPDAVHAVILMSDGEYNYYGDPLARGKGSSKSDWSTTQNDYTYFSGLGDSQQNMAVYAKNNSNSVRLYMISFSNDITENSTTWETMDALAEETGGKHYHAVTGDDLARIYTEIAGELKTEAGVNTAMNLDFGTIQVNDEDRVGSGVFTYVHKDGVSTTIESWVDNKTGPYEIIPRHTRDDTSNWTASSPHLPFDIGTVQLGQTWETTFRLAVLADGNINIFGPDSAITFNDGAAELDLPATFITAVPDLNNTGLVYGTLHLTNPRYTSVEVPDFLTAAWDLVYTGSETVTETLEYSNDGGLSWVWFDTLTADNATTGGVTTLDVRNLPPGEYRVRVHADADDAPYTPPLAFPPIQIGGRQKPYIRLA